ncbi:hypothetical protein AB0K18_14370 [Nonomuraea sp. NPDC049421]|uniref:hypothetical protein n=1 Tax=Nonomuraea sp. NPDC049421 TaxID=3155275 RepID=UPI00343F0B0A
MDDDRRVWPPQPGPRHRRPPSPPPDPAPPDDVPPPRPKRTRPPYQDQQRQVERQRAEQHQDQRRQVEGRRAEQHWAEARPAAPLSEPPGAWGRRDEPPDDAEWGRSDGSGWARTEDRQRRHPLDLEPDESFWNEDDPDDADEPSWSARIRGAAGGAARDAARDDSDDLPPSAHLYGAPTAPRQRAGGVRSGTGAPWKVPRKVAAVLTALAAAAALVAAATVTALRFVAEEPEPGRLSDPRAGVTATLPEGWRTDPVPPVTGFTSVARDDAGGLVMARPMEGPIEDAKKATAQATELYSKLLLKGDRVTVVDDRRTQDGHTRALRAEYRDVVNRPAYLRVMLVTRQGKPVLLLGLLQPEEESRRQALDTVLTSLR